MNTLWIAKATCSNGARVYLPDYVGISKGAVEARVIWRSGGCKGTVEERLIELKWES